MRVSFSQTGGFAGRFLGCELDTATLPPADAARLQALVTASGVARLSSRRRPELRDVPVVAITVETEAGPHTVTYDLIGLPEEIKPLVGFLLERSGPLFPGSR